MALSESVGRLYSSDTIARLSIGLSCKRSNPCCGGIQDSRISVSNSMDGLCRIYSLDQISFDEGESVRVASRSTTSMGLSRLFSIIASLCA